MTVRWTREALRTRVDALADEHSGKELVEAVRRLGEGLAEDERQVLGSVLLERARADGAFEQAWHERAAARGWFRRRLERLER